MRVYERRACTGLLIGMVLMLPLSAMVWAITRVFYVRADSVSTY